MLYMPYCGNHLIQSISFANSSNLLLITLNGKMMAGRQIATKRIRISMLLALRFHNHKISLISN